MCLLSQFCTNWSQNALGQETWEVPNGSKKQLFSKELRNVAFANIHFKLVEHCEEINFGAADLLELVKTNLEKTIQRPTTNASE